MTTSSKSTVTVRVLLFARYADALGDDTLTLTVSPPATLASVIKVLRSRPGGEVLPERPLCAVNLVQARLDSPVEAGDEIAVLPPLAGG